LKSQGFHITQTGGDVIVLPTANPDQLGALQNGDVAAVWTVEPWVTRLEREAHAKVMLEETDVITTWLAASTTFLNNQRELANKIAAANAELTQWIQANPEEAQQLLIAELRQKLTSLPRWWRRRGSGSNLPRRSHAI